MDSRLLLACLTRKRFDPKQRARGGRAVEGAVETDRPAVGAPGAPVIGVQVHDQAGAESPHPQGEVLRQPIRVARVRHHVTDRHPRKHESLENLD